MTKALCLFAAVFCVGSLFVVLSDPVPAKCRNHAAKTCIPGKCETCAANPSGECCCLTTSHCKCNPTACEKME